MALHASGLKVCSNPFFHLAHSRFEGMPQLMKGTAERNLVEWGEGRERNGGTQLGPTGNTGVCEENVAPGRKRRAGRRGCV